MWIFKGYKLIAPLFLLLSVSLSAKASEVTSFIVGGDDVEIEYPWIAALYRSDSFICGAVLISNRWLATAAHCVYEDDDSSGDASAYDASYFKVIVGESTHYSTTFYAPFYVDVHNINSVIIHPSYDNESASFDIALLELTNPISQPGPAIATSERFTQIEEDDLLTVIGYGQTDGVFSASAIPSILQEASLPFVPTNSCYWGSIMTDDLFCAGYESTNIDLNICSGDSGGPIFTDLDGELTLVGLVSAGDSNCADHPGIFTKVSSFNSWILSYIDGYQVVEQGAASYDPDTETFSSGLISVYHYGDESDDDLEIGPLSFTDSSYLEAFVVQDNCSDSSVAATDVSCQISFELNEMISEDQLYNAQLEVNSVSYELRFTADYADEEPVSEPLSSSSSGGALHYLLILSLLMLPLRRSALIIK